MCKHIDSPVVGEINLEYGVTLASHSVVGVRRRSLRVPTEVDDPWLEWLRGDVISGPNHLKPPVACINQPKCLPDRRILQPAPVSTPEHSLFEEAGRTRTSKHSNCNLLSPDIILPRACNCPGASALRRRNEPTSRLIIETLSQTQTPHSRPPSPCIEHTPCAPRGRQRPHRFRYLRGLHCARLTGWAALTTIPWTQNPPPPPSSTKSGRFFGRGGFGTLRPSLPSQTPS